MHRARFFPAFLLLFWTPLILFAQQPETKGSISGVILNSQTKEPLRRAEVTLMMTSAPVGRAHSPNSLGTSLAPKNTSVSSSPEAGGSSAGFRSSPVGPGSSGGGVLSHLRKSVMTDEAGEFIFPDLDAGNYIVSSARKGFLPTRYGARHPNASGYTRITISDGQKVTNIRVEMMPQSVLSGRVVNEEGEPFQGVLVQIVDVRMTAPSRPGMTFRRGGMTQTDDRGEFRITDLAPGKYHIHFSPVPTAASLTVGEFEDRKAYVPLFYPGTADRTQAEKIEITPGADLSGFQIRMQRSEVAGISGKVLDLDGQPATAPFVVNLMPKGALLARFPAAGYQRLENGGFQLTNVPPGSYTLNIQMQAVNGVRAMYQQDLEVGKDDIEDLLVQVQTPFSVSGRILLGKDAGQINPSDVQIRIWPLAGAFYGIPSAQIESDGTFTLSSIYAGKHEIQIFFPPGAGYLDSVRYRDQDVTVQEINITGEGTFQVRVDGNGGTVTGSVTSDGKPASGGAVLILPVKKELRSFPVMKMGTPDQNGAFTVEQIAPGDYLVLALDTYDSVLLQDEARMQELERKAKKISVRKGTSESVQLELAESGV